MSVTTRRRYNAFHAYTGLNSPAIRPPGLAPLRAMRRILFVFPSNHTIMANYQTLRTIEQLAKPNSPFSANTLRWHVFNSRTNGLGEAVIRIGRRVYIDELKFNEWIDSFRQGRAA